MSHHLDEVGIGPASCGNVQLVTHKLAFIFHPALICIIHHAPRECETISAASALDNLVIKLRDPNGSGYARAFLVKI